MDKPITRFETVLLFWDVTAYKMAKDTPTLFGSNFDSVNKRFASALTIAPQAGMIFFLDDYYKWDFTITKVLLCGCPLFNMVLSFAYDKKIEEITQEYYKYYSVIFYILFIISVIVSFAYMFNMLIGYNPKT